MVTAETPVEEVRRDLHPARRADDDVIGADTQHAAGLERDPRTAIAEQFDILNTVYPGDSDHAFACRLRACDDGQEQHLRAKGGGRGPVMPDDPLADMCPALHLAVDHGMVVRLFVAGGFAGVNVAVVACHVDPSGWCAAFSAFARRDSTARCTIESERRPATSE